MKEERFKIKEFLESGDDDTAKWEIGISEMEKTISKLQKGWNEDYYSVSLRTKERPIKIFGREATLIVFRPFGVEFTKDAWKHKEQWCPYIKKPIEYWIKIGHRRWLWNVGILWYIEKIEPKVIEKALLTKTPEYKKAAEEISDYASKEINKITNHLKCLYPEPEFDNLIRENTDLNYYY